MDTLNISCRSHIGIEFHQAFDVQDTLFENLVLGIEQTFLSLGMGLTYCPIEGWKENQPSSSPGFHTAASLYGLMRPGLIWALTRMSRPTV